MTPGSWRGALQALHAALGPVGSARVLADTAWRQWTDAPFAALGPTSEPREAASRAQAAPIVSLYRALLAQLPAASALGVAGAFVDAGALTFLAKSLPEIAKSHGNFASGNMAEMRQNAERMLSRFFTATAEVTDVGPDHVAFTVTACALHRLVIAVGHPELAQLFCRADGLFFAAHGYQLERPTTLAAGGTTCPFHIRRA